MATRTLSAFDIKSNWPSAWGASGKLVITLSRTVVSEDGVSHPASAKDGSKLSAVGFHWEAAITVASGVGTTASLPGLINTDTATPDHVATYNIYIYDARGKMREKLNSKPYYIHESLNGNAATFTWEQWVNAMEFVQFRGDNVFIGDRATVQGMIDALPNVKANTSPTYGSTSLSVAPASASDPIAVGDNDLRVTADQAANAASIRTLGTGALQAAAGNDSRFSAATVSTLADLPAAGTEGRLRKLTDSTRALVVDTGTQWAGLVPMFNVRLFGAIGDGTTDDTAALNLAIAAFNAMGRGRLHFPAGTYKITAALTTITAQGVISGDGMSIGTTTKMPLAEEANNFGTKITCTSATADVFTVTAQALKFQDLVIVNTAATTPSAGSGIKVAGTHSNQKVDFESVGVEGFYINFDVQVGYTWTMHNCSVMSPVLYGVRINNSVTVDAGDWAISDTSLFQGYYDSSEAIRVEGAGGGKIVNVKINSYLFTFDDGIKVVPANTVIMAISNTSIENVRGYGINIAASSLGWWRNVHISNVEIYLTPTVADTKTAIFLTNIRDASISAVSATAETSSGAPMILLDGCSNIGIDDQTVINQTAAGFGRLVQATNGYSGVLLPTEDTVALTISSNTITPLFQTSHVGAGLIKTITVPDSASRRASVVTVIPDAAFTYDNTGNIVGSGTATVGRAMTFTYTPTTSKWYPSY